MRLRKGDLPKLIVAVLLITASAVYLVVVMRQRGHVGPTGPAKTASTMSATVGAQPQVSQTPSETPQAGQTQAPSGEPTAIGPPSSELRPGTKLVVKVVDPFGLPPSAQKKPAETQKPPQTATVKASPVPSFPLPPALVAEAVRPFAGAAESAQAQGRSAASTGTGTSSAESPAVPPSVACTIEGDERVAILRTSTGRSVVVRAGDKVEGYRVTSIRTGEVVLRASDGGIRVMTVGAKTNGS